MTVRHLTAASNVDADGYLVDPSAAHHGALRGSRVDALGGPIDVTTHLNLDFPDHELGECIVVESLEANSPVVITDDGEFARAIAKPGAHKHLGRVEQGARRAEWLRVLAERRAAQQS